MTHSVTTPSGPTSGIRPGESGGTDGSGGTGPALADVLDVLDNEYCRRIFVGVDEPTTAGEISEATGIPLSTVYRELDRLVEAELVREGIRIAADGTHPVTYERRVSGVTVRIAEDGGLDLELVERTGSDEDERRETARTW